MDIGSIYFSRKKDSHKGDFGYVLIIAGSRMYSGSPVFNAISALRCGADLAMVAGHKRAVDIAAGFSPDIITYPLEGELEAEDVRGIVDLSQKFDALVIGGGLARLEKTHAAARKIICEINLPMVIDAEGIRALAEQGGVPENKRAVLTPNAPEFELLCGEKIAEGLNGRKEQVRKLAEKIGAVVALKGAADIISDGKRIVINRTGNAFMTKGGFGDTLAGVCGALLARGINPLKAAEAACYINGRAGDLAAKKYGESLMASDIFDYFPQAIRSK